MKRNIFHPVLQAGLLIAVIFAISMSACKKEKSLTPGNDSTGGNNNNALSDEDSLKFYVWYNTVSDSQTIPLYYWYNQVPAIKWYDDVAYPNADSLLYGQNGIASYPMYQSKQVDRYSFLDRTGAVSGQLEGGVAGDFGFDVSAAQEQNTGNIVIAVTYAYGASPAGQAGVQRGWVIKAINGNSNMTLDGGANTQRIIDAIYYSASTTFTFTKNDSTDETITLDTATYHINPVLKDTVYDWNGKKVGYFAYNSFIDVSGSDANAATAKSEIDDAFTKFKNAGVQDLIVDERYNHGGSVASAEYLDNLMAPSAANGQTMYQYKFNDQLTSYFQSDPNLQANLQPVKYQLASLNLNLSKIFFLVGKNTASASELTINNLKPYMDVYLIGKTTYGKPVGFFTIPISFVTDSSKTLSHVADLYAINFETVNKNNQGQYYYGMTPDKDETDYVGYNWGDTSDPRIQDVYKFMTTGNFRSSQLRLAGKAGLERIENAPALNKKAFYGMVNYGISQKLNTDLLKKH